VPVGIEKVLRFAFFVTPVAFFLRVCILQFMADDLVEKITKKLLSRGVPFVKSDLASRLRGCPSFFVFAPTRAGSAGVAILIKHPRKKQSPRQCHWFELLAAQSLRLAVISDLEDFEERAKRWWSCD